MRVLFVNQIPQLSGAERSLLTLLRGLPSDVEPLVACPPGDFTDAVRDVGVPVVGMPGTDVSFRLHPVRTTRGLGEMARAAVTLRRLAAEHRADVLHANSTRAGLIAVTSRRLGAPPVIVHVRDWVPAGRSAWLALDAVSRGADLVLANSRFVAAQFDGHRLRGALRVVANPVDTERFDPAAVDRAEARAGLGLAPSARVLAVVAQLTPWKGQDDAVRTTAALARQGIDVVLLVAGSAKFVSKSARYDNAAYERDLRELVRELGVADRVRFLGEREDVPEVLAATDILLVPSWREAFGRIAVEAMAMRVPVVATDVGGPSQIVSVGRDGLLLPPRQPELWAAEIAALLADPSRLEEMGREGRKAATTRFTVDAHVKAVIEAYADVAQPRNLAAV